jgi:tetratricopeptide (TPR) repeat protein
MRILTLMTMMMLVLAPVHSAEAFLGFGEKKEKPFVQAKKYFENHEYYTAHRFAQQALEQNPQDPEVTKLMADILDKEIERQKEQLLPQAIEEMNGDDKQDAIKTWLERSRTLFVANQYDLALFAAEKVFLYDANNATASELIDQIKGKALKEGKAETLFIHKIYKEEIADRLEQYRAEAEDLTSQGLFGQAQFTAEKILMLEPEDPKALAVLQKVLSHMDRTRSEAP